MTEHRRFRASLAVVAIAALGVGQQGSVAALTAPAQLAARLGAPGLVVLDARPLRDYVAGHVPGAQSLLVENLRSSQAGVPAVIYPREVLSVVLGRLGITSQSSVVVYGPGGDADATYVASVLLLADLRQVSVLDGGFARWSAEQQPISTDRPPVAPTTFRAGLDSSALASFEQVRTASATGSALLIDARPRDAYEKGHIPGAISRPFTSDLVASTGASAGSFRPLAELAAEYGGLGANGKKPVIVYCNSGNMASSTYYLLRHVLGQRDVRLYDGSWLEWSARGGPTAASRKEDEPLERARRAASALGAELLQRLTRELSAGGPTHAVQVCSEVAPQIAREHSRDGLVVRRVSLKTRNPENAPDPWEREQLARMEAETASGARPEETVARTEGELRLLRPIFVVGTCLTCHGEPAGLDPGVRRLLAERYPDDQATGYRSGDFRGAVSVRVSLGP